MEVLAEKLRGLSKGLLPAAGKKAEKSPRYPSRCDARGAAGCSFRGKGINRFPNYSLLEKAPAARSQPTATTKVLQKQKGYPPESSGNFGRWSTQPLGHPLPVGTERGERGRERVGEGVPTTKLFLLLLRQLGKKKRELIWGSRGWVGLDGLGHIRVHLYIMPWARGHGC